LADGVRRANAPLPARQLFRYAVQRLGVESEVGVVERSRKERGRVVDRLPAQIGSNVGDVRARKPGRERLEELRLGDVDRTSRRYLISRKERRPIEVRRQRLELREVHLVIGGGGIALRDA